MMYQIDEEEYLQIARHIGPWFRCEIARHLKMCDKDQSVRFLHNAIINTVHGGSYHVSSGPYEKITVKEWHEAVSRLGCQEATRQRYWIFKKEFVPKEKENELSSFISVLFETIGKVCRGRNWGLELNLANGNKGGMLGEWIEMNKTTFKRKFWKLWKKYQRTGK